MSLPQRLSLLCMLPCLSLLSACCLACLSSLHVALLVPPLCILCHVAATAPRRGETRRRPGRAALSSSDVTICTFVLVRQVNSAPRKMVFFPWACRLFFPKKKIETGKERQHFWTSAFPGHAASVHCFLIFFESQLRHTLAAVEPRCECAHAASLSQDRVGDDYEQTQVFFPPVFQSFFSVLFFPLFFSLCSTRHSHTNYVFNARAKRKHIYIYRSTRSCMYVCMYVYIYIYIYMHTGALATRWQRTHLYLKYSN